MEKTHQRLPFLRHMGFQMKCNRVFFISIQLWTFDRRGGVGEFNRGWWAAGRILWSCIFRLAPRRLDHFSSLCITSISVDRLDNFELADGAFSLDFLVSGRRWHCGNLPKFQLDSTMETLLDKPLKLAWIHFDSTIKTLLGKLRFINKTLI